MPGRPRIAPPAGVALLVVGSIFAAVLTACGAEDQGPPDAASSDPTLIPLRNAYRIHCAACHGRGGAGAKNLYPPLRGSSWANGDPEIPIRVVLQGLEGPLTVEGEKYLNKMPPLGARLKDEEIAGILTYVRASWGNSAPAVTAGEVARVRAAAAGKRVPWTALELGLLPGAPRESHP